MDQMEMPTDKAKISSYIAADLKKEFDRLCEARDRTISNMVEILIREAVANAKNSGELPTEKS